MPVRRAGVYRTRRLTSTKTIVAAIVAALAIGAVSAGRLHAGQSACQIEDVERIVAIGDVHGAYDRMVEILRTTGILDTGLHWSAGKTHFVQVGDVLDRGTDSRKAMDLLRRLEGEAARAGGAVHLLLGNHEVMRMLGDLRYVTPGEYQTFETPQSETVRENFIRPARPEMRNQLLKETPLGLVEMRVAFGRRGSYGEWLRQLNVIVRINGILFLHGGISPTIGAFSCDAINATVRKELTDDLDKTRAAPLHSLAARADGPLWYRGLAQQPETAEPQVDGILSKYNARAIVIGHTVVPGGRIAVRFSGKVFQIDTGMQSDYVPTGRASALEIKDGVFTAIYQDRQDTLIRMRTESTKSGSISKG